MDFTKPMIKNTYQWLYKKPRCIKRLGSPLFIKLPLYKTKIPFEPIYINDNLFKAIFQKEMLWSEQFNFIKDLFSITLDATQSTEGQCGWAFVDKQGEDPYGISLMGNLGSGRAYYTGTCFNIKGEKTPLATSMSPNHSNGVLKIKDGIWSALIGNSLYDEFHVKPSPVLAILRIDLERCIIVRIDEQGALDRITHLFFHPLPLTAKQLKQTATNLGHLEADKFVHRILHGAWSCGNTSLSGHLIDYDSVCAVKGRQPQFSFSQSYPDNYFGYEHLGQVKVLKSLCDHPVLNSQGISLNDLEQVLKKSFKQHLIQGLLSLMGFEEAQMLSQQFIIPLQQLSQTFYDLSHYSYYLSPQNLFTNYPAALFFHLFDFSSFFRIYPLLKASQQFTIPLGLSILMGSAFQQSMILSESYEHDGQVLTPQVKAFFGDYLISWQESDREELEKKASQFITDYDHLFHLMQQKVKQDIYLIAARAYVINEDRFYLLPVFSLESFLIDLQTQASSYVIHRFIQQFIQANQRTPRLTHLNYYQTNYRLFMEGFSSILINIYGEYQVAFTLHREYMMHPIHEEDIWQIVIHNQLVPAMCVVHEEVLHIQSVHLPCSQLILQYSRDNVFLIHPYTLYRNNEPIKLTDLFFPDLEYGYYF